MNVGSLFSGVGGIDLGLERECESCSSASGTSGVDASSPSTGPESPSLKTFVRSTQPHGPHGSSLDDERWEEADTAPPCTAHSAAQRVLGVSLVGTDYATGDGIQRPLKAGNDRLPPLVFSQEDSRARTSPSPAAAGGRSGLFFEFARIADELVRPGGWILVENVPGLLSSASGRDFAVVVRTLGDIGFHDLAWRVLDSRYFGVPQRRRRVFIVGRRAVGAGAREVLLEPESGGGDFAPRREKGSRVAATLSRGSSGAGVSAPGRRQEEDENIVSTLQRRGHRIDAEGAAGNHLVVPALVKRYGKGTDSDASDAFVVNLRGREDGAQPEVSDAASLRAASGGSSRSYAVAHTLRAEGFDASEDGTGRGTPLVAGTVRSHMRPGSNAFDVVGAPADPHGMRATPELPGRVDDPRPDGPRYAAMGNAVTVNVAEWIGRRILEYEEGRLAA